MDASWQDARIPISADAPGTDIEHILAPDQKQCTIVFCAISSNRSLSIISVLCPSSESQRNLYSCRDCSAVWVANSVFQRVAEEQVCGVYDQTLVWKPFPEVERK